jgi:hypothetical protein
LLRSRNLSPPSPPVRRPPARNAELSAAAAHQQSRRAQRRLPPDAPATVRNEMVSVHILKASSAWPISCEQSAAQRLSAREQCGLPRRRPPREEM